MYEVNLYLSDFPPLESMPTRSTAGAVCIANRQPPANFGIQHHVLPSAVTADLPSVL